MSSLRWNTATYDSAAEKALKEVETRLREKFKERKPSASVPSKSRRYYLLVNHICFL